MKRSGTYSSIALITVTGMVMLSLAGCGKKDEENPVQGSNSVQGEQTESEYQGFPDIPRITDESELPDMSTIEFPTSTLEGIAGGLVALPETIGNSDFASTYLGDMGHSMEYSFTLNNNHDAYNYSEMHNYAWWVEKGIDGYKPISFSAEELGISEDLLKIRLAESNDSVSLSTVSVNGYVYGVEFWVRHCNYTGADDYNTSVEDFDDYILENLFGKEIADKLAEAYFGQDMEYEFGDDVLMIYKDGYYAEDTLSKCTYYSILYGPSSGPENINGPVSVQDMVKNLAGQKIKGWGLGYFDATDTDALIENLQRDLGIADATKAMVDYYYIGEEGLPSRIYYVTDDADGTEVMIADGQLVISTGHVAFDDSDKVIAYANNVLKVLTGRDEQFVTQIGENGSYEFGDIDNIFYSIYIDHSYPTSYEDTEDGDRLEYFTVEMNFMDKM